MLFAFLISGCSNLPVEPIVRTEQAIRTSVAKTYFAQNFNSSTPIITSTSQQDTPQQKYTEQASTQFTAAQQAILRTQYVTKLTATQQAVLKTQYVTKLLNTARTIYSNNNFCKNINDHKSTLFLLTTLGVAKISAEIDYMKEIKDIGAITIIEDGITETREIMSILKNSVDEYETPYNNLLDLHAVYILLCNAAKSTVVLSNDEISDKNNEFLILFEKLAITFPELRKCLNGVQYCQ